VNGDVATRDDFDHLAPGGEELSRLDEVCSGIIERHLVEALPKIAEDGDRGSGRQPFRGRCRVSLERRGR